MSIPAYFVRLDFDIISSRHTWFSKSSHHLNTKVVSSGTSYRVQNIHSNAKLLLHLILLTTEIVTEALSLSIYIPRHKCHKSERKATVATWNSPTPIYTELRVAGNPIFANVGSKFNWPWLISTCLKSVHLTSNYVFIFNLDLS